jgi:hypothetical protein
MQVLRRKIMKLCRKGMIITLKIMVIIYKKIVYYEVRMVRDGVLKVKMEARAMENRDMMSEKNDG